jgi:hypothetical protein
MVRPYSYCADCVNLSVCYWLLVNVIVDLLVNTLLLTYIEGGEEGCRVIECVRGLAVFVVS